MPRFHIYLRIITGVWLLSLLTLLMPAHAQEETPEATIEPRTVEFVYDWFVRPAYPTGAIFVVVVDRPASDIAFMELTTTIEGQSPETLMFEPEDLLAFSEEFSVFNYSWDEPSQTVVPMFSDIGYEWVVVLGDGSNVTISDTFAYTDPRIEWELLADPANRLNLLMPEGGTEISLNDDGETIIDLTANTIWDALNPTLDLLERETGPLPELTLALFYADRRPINPCMDPNYPALPVDERTNESIPCNGERTAESFAVAGITPLETDFAAITNVQPPLTELVSRTAYAPLWENVSVPAWFAYGLIEFYRPQGKNIYQETVRAAQRVNRLYTLAEMGDETADDPALWQAQSYSMVLYIAQQYGVPALFELARSLSPADSFTTAYENITGRSLAALLPNLQNWIFTNRAEDDFLYNPYLETTPSPTPSLSPTPFPPTVTPTATPTVTNTPTATVTGFLSATPLPSLTATRTVTRAPFTVTPRPAGSLPEPTALPTVDTQNETMQNLPLMIGVGVIFALLIIMTAVLIRRSTRRPY